MESRYSLGVSKDSVWCNMGPRGQVGLVMIPEINLRNEELKIKKYVFSGYFKSQLILTSGSGAQPTTCTFGVGDDDGIYMVEIQCGGYSTSKSTFSMASAKGTLQLNIHGKQ